MEMNKKNSPEPGPEKIDENEIIKEKFDFKSESDEILSENESPLVQKYVAKHKTKIDIKNNFIDSLKELNKLGYKSRLDIITRGEINKIEKEVSKEMGTSVEEIRAQFLSITKEFLKQKKNVSIIPNIYIFSDYRTFLINAIAVARLRKIHFSRF